MTVKAVFFDAFGTLRDIGIKRRPFVQLARFHPDRRRARELIMTRALSLRDAAHELQVQDVDLAMLEEELATELASIRLYPEVPEVLETLRRQGFRIGIVSNLAAPYADPLLLRLLPFEPDARAWSFEVGHLKPDPRIFASVCERLNVAPHEALMVGDTFADDYAGALASGLNALHLDRRGEERSKVAATIRTLDEILPALRVQSDSVSTGQTGSVGLS